jgi:hypothetical protein
VKAALAKGTFSTGFSLDRMTWIKPSFGWMLYRSGYATKTRQEAILKIKLKHEGFLAILRQSIETSQNPQVFPTIDDWKRALRNSDVRHQWDPDRNLKLVKLNRRAIQIGIQGETVQHYVNDWIIGLEEVTELAHAVHTAAKMKQLFPPVLLERVYPIEPDLVHSLGINTGEAEA